LCVGILRTWADVVMIFRYCVTLPAELEDNTIDALINYLSRDKKFMHDVVDCVVQVRKFNFRSEILRSRLAWRSKITKMCQKNRSFFETPFSPIGTRVCRQTKQSINLERRVSVGIDVCLRCSRHAALECTRFLIVVTIFPCSSGVWSSDAIDFFMEIKKDLVKHKKCFMF